jgi:hypothetical protein
MFCGYPRAPFPDLAGAEFPASMVVKVAPSQ